jgi:hypothetical protein
MHINFMIKNISFHFTDLGYYMDYRYKITLKNYISNYRNKFDCCKDIIIEYYVIIKLYIYIYIFFFYVIINYI